MSGVHVGQLPFIRENAAEEGHVLADWGSPADGVIDPFGSLSRLKQRVIGKVTREDHPQLMNTMIRFYSSSMEALKKQQMAFELTDLDHKLIKFGKLFRSRFMEFDVSLPLKEALDACWQTLAECFEPEELLMKEEMVRKYYPTHVESEASAAEA